MAFENGDQMKDYLGECLEKYKNDKNIFNKALDMINFYMKRIELEKRVIEDSKSREERMEKRFMEVMNSLEKINSKMDEKIDKMSEKIDSTNKWITGLCISTIVGIAAIVVTVVIAFLQR